VAWQTFFVRGILRVVYRVMNDMSTDFTFRNVSNIFKYRRNYNWNWNLNFKEIEILPETLMGTWSPFGR